ncbi:MAG: hypothetical protein RL417_898 [Pseudomonadota bacterium]|jgi:MinD-like ATPase involved in chromosome partitioning or flagellar assembly
MLKLVVVDHSAESRHRLVDAFQQTIGAATTDLAFIPRFSIVPRSPQEVRFHTPPDICVVGPELAEDTTGECAELRRLIPTGILIAQLRSPNPSLHLIEHLARSGVDDVLPPGWSAAQLLQKIVLLGRKRASGSRGKLVVVGAGKGGVGVTSIAAAVADIAGCAAKRVVLVDFDIETQDAARFLRARPFVNEMLESIFEEKTPLTAEFVEQCCVSIDESGGAFKVMPPCLGLRSVGSGGIDRSRTLMTLLEILDQMFDVTVVDLGSARGAFLEVFHRSADVAILVASSDPAALYPSVEWARRVRGYLGAQSRIVIVENQSPCGGLAGRFVRGEIGRAAALGSKEAVSVCVPHSKRGALWPGSGETLYRCGGRKIRRALDRVWGEVEPSSPPATAARQGFGALLKRGMRRLVRREPLLSPTAPYGDDTLNLPASHRETPLEIPLFEGVTGIDPRSLVSGLDKRLATVTES